MNITKATRQINIGAGVLMATLGVVALGASVWLLMKGATPTPVLVPPPVSDVATCKALAPVYGLMEQSTPKLPKDVKAPWSPDGLHFIQANQNDPKMQLLNITAFQTRCSMSLDYFCMGVACEKVGGSFMRAVFMPKVPVASTGAPPAPGGPSAPAAPPAGAK